MSKQRSARFFAGRQDRDPATIALTPTIPAIARVGILCFFIFACLENMVCLASVRLYWQYYPISLALWLLLGATAIFFFLAFHALIRRIFGKSGPRTLLLACMLFLPNMAYTFLQTTRRTFRFSYLSLFALLLLELAAFVLVLRLVHGEVRKKNGGAWVDGASIVLFWGGSSIWGTLVVGAELQDKFWLLNVLVIVSYHFIIPVLFTIFLLRGKLAKRPFRFLAAGGGLVALVLLSHLLVAPVLHEIAYGHGRTLPGAAPAPEAGRKRPNIILIVMDTARAASMSLYGYSRQTTPQLQNLARDAVVFPNAISSTSWTLPAHATMFTGLPTYLHFATQSHSDNISFIPLARHYDTLAEILAAKGYATGAATANTGPLSPEYGLNQGFAYYWWGRTRARSLFAYPVIQGISVVFPNRFVDELKMVCGLSTCYDARRINQVALRWIHASARAARPWFFFVNYMDTHGIAYLPSPFSHLFAPPPRLHVPGAWLRNPATGFPQRLDPPYLAESRGWYDNEMAYLDHEIGCLLSRLKESQLYDDALIVITADHGELLGEHKEFGHGSWLYQELLHVPLLVKYPKGALAGQRNEKAVQNSDIFAEILAQAGAGLPAGIVGQPFARADHPIFAEVEQYPDFKKKWPGRYARNLQAIYSKLYHHYKLIHAYDGENELYNIGTDGRETACLADAEKTSAILDELQRFLAGLQPRREKWLKQQPAQRQRMDPEMQNRLRSLGYFN